MVMWALFAGLTALAVVIVVTPLLRRGADADAEAGDVSVYRDQFAEIDRDRDAGLIGAQEAEAARAEIGRRLIRAARTGGDGAAATTGRVRDRVLAVAVVVALPLAAVAGYLVLGHPDLPDAPLSARLSGPDESKSIEALVVRVETHLAQAPDDLRGWEVLAPIYMKLDRAGDAVRAWKTAIRLGGVSERRAVGLGEALVAAGDGSIGKDAQAAFADALRVAPTAVLPRMYLAAALLQDGRAKESVDAWKALIASGTDADPWIGVAREELAKAEAAAAAAAGGAPTGAAPPADAPPQAAAPGPSRADVEAAAQLSGADRQKMIADMVTRLDERLRERGGTIEEWERLVRALRVMGRADEATAAVARARTAFAGDAAALARLDALAAQ